MTTIASSYSKLSLAIGLVAGAAASAQELASPEARERCATRVSIALLGASPSMELQANPNPQSMVEGFLATPQFIERFSRFANAQFNSEPGATSEEDAAYHLVKEVLTRNLPWKETFVGPWRVEKTSTGVKVMSDPDGLGYFRSTAWLRRYAGNEQDGYKLATAYRIMNNVLGVELVASTNAPDVDISSTGRKSANCASCHYEGPFALDLVARTLTRRVGEGDKMTFAESSEAPQTILGGVVIHNDKELVNAMVSSEDFRFNACRLAFKFVYGRSEYSCEGAVFDRCMDEFKQYGTIQSAIAAVSKDPSFCQ